MSEALARGFMISLSSLLLVYTWMLYRGVRRVSASPARSPSDPGGPLRGGGRSGEGSPVLFFSLQLEPPGKLDGHRVSFRVREDGAGLNLRSAIQSGSVRYCAREGLVYRVSIVRGGSGSRGSMFDVLLSPPTGSSDPDHFPTGAAASEGYTLPVPAGGSRGDSSTVDAYMAFF